MRELFVYPTILSIAGSDSCGGAGIQADLKAASALGVYVATAITAVTVQNTLGVQAVHPIPSEVVAGQIAAVVDDLSPQAIKIGMVSEVPIIRAIAGELRRTPVPTIVYDPVMISTSGHRLITEEAVEVIKHELFPLCTLITPNLREAEALLGKPIRTMDDMKREIHHLRRWGDYAILLKGGHLEGEVMADLLLMPGESESLVFRSEKVDTPNTHGTGCTLSSAIAALCARGHDLPTAVRQAKEYVSQAIRQGADVKIGHGHGSLNHFFSPLPLKKFSPVEKKNSSESE